MLAVAGVSSKAERTLERIAEARRVRQVRLDELQARLHEFRRAGARQHRCAVCTHMFGEYLTPVGGYVNRCPRCGAWNELTTD